ncbi:MAG: hypothetical protein K2Z81_21750, partial [Cyanobacteria bacterium]|nr:hypothetical protein [Cyanobacteriota bacterium]
YFQEQALRFEREIGKTQRPYFRLVSAYANQSLLSPAGQMDTFSPSTAQYGFFPNPQTEVRLSYVPTIFGRAALRGPRLMGQEFRGTVLCQPTDRLRLFSRLGLFQFVGTRTTSGGMTVLGAAGGSYQLNDRLRIGLGYRRDILGGNLLSAVGLNLPESGLLVGRIQQNYFYANASVRFTNKTSGSFSIGGGTDVGTRVKVNPWMRASSYLSRSLYSGRQDALVSGVYGSYQWLFNAFKYDESIPGNAVFQVQPPQSLAARLAILKSSREGNTALTPELERRVGNYFSPSQFYAHSWGLGVNGHLIKSVYWRGSVGLGIGTAAPNLGVQKDDTGVYGFGGGASAVVTYRLSHRSVHEQGWYFLQSALDYRRQVLYSQSKYFF